MAAVKAPVAKAPVAAPAKAPRKAPAAAAAPAAPAAPPKPRLSLTDEEISAAVNGVLTPRKQKGTVDQEALVQVSEGGRPVGRPIGLSTGLPVMGCWAYVFQQNEKAGPKQKLTDEQISDFMKSEYPGRETAAFNNVQYCRRLYNTGRFTKGTAPKVQSNRYAAGGAVDNPVRGGGFVKKGAAPVAKAPAPAVAPARPAPARPAAKAPVAKAPAAAPAPVRRPVKIPQG